jgi:hypothetical protein
VQLLARRFKWRFLTDAVLYPHLSASYFTPATAAFSLSNMMTTDKPELNGQTMDARPLNPHLSVVLRARVRRLLLHKHPEFIFETTFQSVAFHFNIIARLQIQPEAFR